MESSGRELRSDAHRNREELLRAAAVAIHRDGPAVPMATIAAGAGVGVGTLYRHFADREALLAELVHRSFTLVLANAERAQAEGGAPVESLRLFVRAAMRARNELVLPLHGGPTELTPRTRAVQQQAHRTLEAILAQGRAEGSIRDDVRARDVVVFGAMLSQPRDATPGWTAACHRLLDTYLRGLAP